MTLNSANRPIVRSSRVPPPAALCRQPEVPHPGIRASAPVTPFQRNYGWAPQVLPHEEDRGRAVPGHRDHSSRSGLRRPSTPASWRRLLTVTSLYTKTAAAVAAPASSRRPIGPSVTSGNTSTGLAR